MISSRIRIPVNFRSRDAITDLLSGKSPEQWVGTDVRFEVGFMDASALAEDISNLASVTLEVFASTRTGLPYMAATLSAAELLDTLTQEQWDGGAPEHAHAVFEFTQEETALPMGADLRKEFWLVVSCLTNNGTAKRYTLGAGPIDFLQDGTPSDQVGPLQGGNIIPGGAEYDGAGEYTLAGLTVNKVYKWSPGANDDDITSGAQTLDAEGNFTSQAVTALLTGTPSTPVTAVVRSLVYLNAEEADARYLKANIPAWADDIQFYAPDLCSDQGGIWIALQDSLDEAPPALPTTANAYWRNVVLPGEDGTNGTNAYVYVAYASANDGTGFSAVSGDGLDYLAVKASAVALTPVVGDFAGLWRKYIGTDGDDGDDGLNAFTTTTAGFVMPALDATVNVAVTSSIFAAVGQNVFVTTAGTLQVTDKPDGTTLTLKNLGYTGNAAAATNIATAQQVSPGGIKGADGNGGDMILAEAQTVTGAKTFVDQAAKIRNVPGTFATSLRSAATANRTATFPDRSGTVALAPAPVALDWAATVNLDLAGELWRTLALNGDTTFASLNRAPGLYLLLEILGGAEDYTTVWPAWKWKGEPAPASLKAGKRLQIELWCFGNTEADITARYHMEGSFTSCETTTISTEDETEIHPAADFAYHTVIDTIETDDYDAPFIHDRVLKALNATAGDRCDVYADLPASLNPTIRYWNDVVDEEEGEPLFTITGAAFAQHIKIEFAFIEGAWEFLKWSYVDGKLAGNRCSRAEIEFDDAGQVIDFDGPSVQELVITDDVTFSTLDTSRAPAGVTKSVLVKVTASGGPRAIAFHASINEVGSSWIASLSAGESCWINFTSTGTAETDTDAAMAARS